MKKKYKGIDLFCGIGGFRLAMNSSQVECVFSSDNDKFAQQTYEANFHEVPTGDIKAVDEKDIPKFDILTAGFPCQPFSSMGELKGFEDTRGTLFFRIVELIQNQIERGHKPKALVLENVRNLKHHDKGKTFKVIKKTLMDLGYKVYDQVLNSSDYGVPQTRNRTFIVCFSNLETKFSYPEKTDLTLTLQDLLEHDVDKKYFLSDRILPTILSNGTGGYKAKSEIDLKIARPLCATMAKMHRACQDNYVTQNGRVRRLTPRECARLQGFSDDFIIPVSDTQAYKQFGNAVTANVSRAVALKVKEALIENGEWYEWVK